MNYNDMLDLMLRKEIKDLDLEPIITAIDKLKETEYWESKNKRLSGLVNSDYIAEKLAMTTVGFNFQIQELIGRIAPDISSGIEYIEMVRNATDVVEACDNLIYSLVHNEHIMVNSHYVLEPETYEYIALRRFNPPMLITPKNWESNSEGGYYDNDLHCVLGSIHSQHKKPQALDVLNLLQEIEWELDPTIMELEEAPNKEFKSPESHEQFKKMAMDSKSVYATYADKKFSFIWQFDKRGRQYSKGYHINLQASGYKKAMLNFAHKELITGEL
jgi:DNA-directed RNA polymerase